MSIGLICWGRFFDNNGNKITVPAPPTDPDKPWLTDFVASQASDIAKHFDFVQWPPLSKCQGGAGAGDDGYGVFDPRDIGSKSQQGSLPTRYGTAEQVRRAFAVLRAHGVCSYVDIVLHQREGSNGGPGVYRYLGSDGKTLNGRRATDPGWFRGSPVPPWCAEDDVPSVEYDFAFGDELSYQHCNPERVTIEDALDYGDWLIRTLGADGARFDDTKGTWAPFVAEFMRSRAMANIPFYSEYFDGNPATLNWWATSAPMDSRSGVEDFTAHWAIQGATGGLNAQVLNGAGYANWNPGLSTVFVDNPDTDTSYGEQIISSKLLGYAWALTIPCRSVLVYGKDYYGPEVWPGAYGLKQWIDNLCWISRNFAYGGMTTPYLDEKVIVLNRDGNGGGIGNSPGLLTAINFDTWNKRTITCQTSFGPNTHLHDYTRHHDDIWTDESGRATFTIPSNAYQTGQSYLCFSRAGFENPLVPAGMLTTQTFFGADDLDTPAAKTGLTAFGSIWAADDFPITFRSLGDPIGLEFTVDRPTGSGYTTLYVANKGALTHFTVEVTYMAASTKGILPNA